MKMSNFHVLVMTVLVALAVIAMTPRTRTYAIVTKPAISAQSAPVGRIVGRSPSTYSDVQVIVYNDLDNGVACYGFKDNTIQLDCVNIR